MLTQKQFAKLHFLSLVCAVSFAQQPSAPTINNVLNAASFAAGQPAVAGSLSSVIGAGLATSTVSASQVPLPTSLGGVSVTFNGVPAPLLYVSPAQINLQVPWNVFPAGMTLGTASMVVTSAGASSRAFSVAIGASAPGIFSLQFGTGNAIAINPDGSLAGPEGSVGGFAVKPASDGGVLVILATGLGAVDSAIDNGQSSSDKLRRTTAVPNVLIGSRPAQVLFSGLTPQFTGVYQINVTIPENADPGSIIPLQIQMGGTTSTDLVTIAIRFPIFGEKNAPVISTPNPVKRLPLNLKPQALPSGTQASFPSYDGDPFYVSLPVRQQETVNSKDVFEQVIVPIVTAMGFERGRSALASPPQDGIPQTVANFNGLVQSVLFEYQNTPQLIRPNTRSMLDAFATGKASDAVNNALLTSEGMSFSQFVAGIQRLEIQYPFQQVDQSGSPGGPPVPIEHTLVYASRWEGQGITTVRGALLSRYTIANKVTIPINRVLGTAVEALALVNGISRVIACDKPEDGPYLILLQYGTDAVGITQLRYTYRMILQAVSYGVQGRFLLWMDANTGAILKLIPLFDVVNANGAVYNRDPGVGTTTSGFAVDSSIAAQYTLKLAGVMNRVDYQGDGFNALDVSISDAANGSSATFANFNQVPINDPAQALCSSGTNKAFQQVNFFGTIHRYYQTTLSLGIYTPFPKYGGVAADPPTPWSPQVEIAGYCNANSGMTYGACAGYFNLACPNFTDNTNGSNNWMNFAHDNTVVGHELAHSITPRYTQARPSDWCGGGVCAIPVGWGAFHDLADFWADHFESTNCTAGWVTKNAQGLNASLNCLRNDEGGYLPRLHSVTVPFNPGSPGDHFPEHRSLATGDYAEGQMGAAILWQIRTGMRSKCRPSGVPQFAVRYARALKNTGFFGSAPPTSDLGIYRYLFDLEHAMIDQWATSGSPGGPPAFAHNGPHTTNKVTAGFARAGVFFIPYQCLDGDALNNDPGFCPGPENGGDAVIDIDDNDPANDLTINGVLQPTFDFLKLGGVAPSLLVWTGPRYKLDGIGGASTFPNPASCNTKFRVEVSTDPGFPAIGTIMSPFTDVNLNPGMVGTPQCYGRYTLSPVDWATLQAGGAGTRIYYRARTRNSADANERLSTSPGNGLWTVPPPYAVITVDGKSDY